MNRKLYYARQAEIWTLGILLCNIVWGCSPFLDDEAARLGDLHLPRFFPNDRWRDSRSVTACLDLVQRCLHINPAQRLTIDGVARHPWLRVQFPDLAS